MLIDFHTHIFPDKIAANAISKLAGIVHLKPTSDGTYTSLIKSMEASGIDISVVLPAITSPRQYENVIRYANQINEEFYKHPQYGIFSLAGIHPESDNYTEQLKQIKSLGFPGLKIHPDFQNVLFNDIRYKRILYKASELGLFVITHTGDDPHSPIIHCTVDMIVEVLDEVAPTNLVLAHMGNNGHYDEVDARLLGRDVYLDTAYSIANMPSQQLCDMIRKHGADKILFGSDIPWTTPAEDVRIFSELGLTPEEYELISHKNALRLLNF